MEDTQPLASPGGLDPPGEPSLLPRSPLLIKLQQFRTLQRIYHDVLPCDVEDMIQRNRGPGALLGHCVDALR